MDLTARVQHVLTTMQWTEDDLVRITHVTKSAVLQWLGKTNKPIRRIGNVRAAVEIERASGYSALWVAEGIGPRMAPPPAARPAASVLSAGEPAAMYAVGAPDADTIASFGQLLQRVAPGQREAVARLVDGSAREGGPSHYAAALQAILLPTQDKRAGNGR